MIRKISNEEYIPQLITLGCIVVFSLVARNIILSYGADSFTAGGIFISSIIVCFSLYLATQILIEEMLCLIFRDKKKIAVTIGAEERTFSNFPETISFNYNQHCREVLQNKAKEEQRKIEAVIAYSQKTLAPYMRESELTQLCSEITKFLSSDWTPEESKSVKVSSQLKSIDLMHFGWNIAQPFNKLRKETSLFLKHTFFHALEDVEISTIQRKLTNTESKSLIPLQENIILESHLSPSISYP